MPFTYVIPDLHGRYDLLMEAVMKIIEHSKVSRSATIVRSVITSIAARRAARSSSA